MGTYECEQKGYGKKTVGQLQEFEGLTNAIKSGILGASCSKNTKKVKDLDY